VGRVRACPRREALGRIKTMPRRASVGQMTTPLGGSDQSESNVGGEEGDPAEIDINHENDEDRAPSSSTSSDDGGGLDVQQIIDKARAAADADDEDVGAAALPDEPPRTKHEVPISTTSTQPLDPVNPTEHLVFLGRVHALLDGVAVIKPATATLNPLLETEENEHPLDEGTGIATSDRAAVGRIDEIFGPITNPMYTLRWHGDEPHESLSEGSAMYVISDRARHASMSSNRGVDASGLHDEELPEHEQEASDDESEKTQKRSLNRKTTQRTEKSRIQKQEQMQVTAPAADAESALRQNRPAAVFEPGDERKLEELTVTPNTDDHHPEGGSGDQAHGGSRGSYSKQQAEKSAARSFVDKMRINTRPSV